MPECPNSFLLLDPTREAHRATAPFTDQTDSQSPTKVKKRRIKPAGKLSASRNRRTCTEGAKPRSRYPVSRQVTKAQARKDKADDQYASWCERNPGASQEAWQARCRAIDLARSMPRARADEVDFHHSGWWRRRANVMRAMEKAHLSQSRIDRFANCGALSVVMLNEVTGAYKVCACFCHDRWCKRCSTSARLRIADNVTQMIGDLDCRHVVLTQVHRDVPHADQIKKIYTDFRNLRRRKGWSEKVDGGAAFLQTHISVKDGLWHVHLHVICSGRYFEQKELSDLWLDVTGDSTNVWIEMVKEHASASREVSRYASEPIDKYSVTDVDELAQLMIVTKGLHRCFTFGTWRKQRLTQKHKAEEDASFRNCGFLHHYLTSAATGNMHAAKVLAILLKQSCPTTGPPHLFYHPEAPEPTEYHAPGRQPGHLT